MTYFPPLDIRQQARTVARRLVRLARANGATQFEVWSAGARLDYGQTETLFVNAVDAVDDSTVVFRDSKGNGLVRILFIVSNGSDAISDYTVTDWSKRLDDNLTALGDDL